MNEADDVGTRDDPSNEGWDIAREFEVTESAKRGARRAAFNEMLKFNGLLNRCAAR